ncbi:MAG: hypothetical protein AAGM22_00170 [Acidobacteriota bacterium]
MPVAPKTLRRNAPSADQSSIRRAVGVLMLAVAWMTMAVPSSAQRPPCERAAATLQALLGSSSEEIRLRAAIGLLQHSCSATTAVGITLRAKPECIEPANKDFDACILVCKSQDPHEQACFDACVDELGVDLTHCPQATNSVAGDRSPCDDCLRYCAEEIQECKRDCRRAEPWDPDCYDDCEYSCYDACSDPCRG